MNKLFLSLLCFLCSFTLLAQTDKEWKSTTLKEFSMRYPSECTADESGELGAPLFLFFPVESSEDQFRENINVTTEDLTGRKISLEEYTKLSQEGILKMITSAKIIESKKVTDATGTYQRMIFTGDQEAFKLKFEQHYRLTKNKAYVVTFTTEEKNFKTYQKKGEEIMATFTVKK